jgi:hypothetical protein
MSVAESSVSGAVGVCPDCGHQHAGAHLAGICIGCACRAGRPGARRGLVVDEVTFLRRIFTALAEPSRPNPGDYMEGFHDGVRMALRSLDEMLAEEPLAELG